MKSLSHLAVGLVVLGTVGAAQIQRPIATTTALSESTTVRAGDEVRLALRIVLPAADQKVQAHIPSDPSLIGTTLTVAAPPGITIEEVVYPEAVALAVGGFDEPLSVYRSEFVIGVRARLASAMQTGTLELPARLRYQACNETVCFLPLTIETKWTVMVGLSGAEGGPQHRQVFETIRFGNGSAPPLQSNEHPGTSTLAPAKEAADLNDGLQGLNDFKIASPAGAYMSSGEFVAFIADAEAGVMPPGWFEGRGPIAILAMVLIGGFALNFTPCVLPMIPINLAIIGAGARAGSRRRGFVLGASYGAAMTLVYGAIGLAVILTAGAFGVINASPWFNLAIAIVFAVLALAMFDLMVIDFSKYSSRLMSRPGRSGSVGLAFTMGGVAALLAGACVAPVVIQVVFFASDLYSSGSSAALALPFVLGLGMAIPWPFAGAGMASLPRPGAWMVRVKQAFGVVIFAMAIYYGHLAFTLFENRRVDGAAVTSSVQEMLNRGWYSSLAAGLTDARREQKPVLIDLWATWCKNCLVMDQTTLKDPVVMRALEGYVKIKIQTENLESPSTADLMQRIGAIGLPAYVVLQPR